MSLNGFAWCPRCRRIVSVSRLANWFYDFHNIDYLGVECPNSFEIVKDQGSVNETPEEINETLSYE